MKIATAAFAAALLCAGVASAQPLPAYPAEPNPGWLDAPTLLTLHGTDADLHVREGRSVHLLPERAGAEVQRRLSREEAADLRVALQRAIAHRLPWGTGLAISVAQEGVEGVFLDVAHPEVRPLLDALLGLREGLRSAPQRPRYVSLTRWEELGAPYQTLRVPRRGKPLLTYALGDGRRWELPTPRLTRQERRSLRRGLRSLLGGEPTFPAAGLLPGPSRTVRYPGGLELVLADKTRLRAYHAAVASGLPSYAQDMAQVLEYILGRVFAYVPRVLGGVVEGDVIRCGQLRVSVKGPLAPLLETLDGEQVLVQALVNGEGTWATALHLLAHDDSGRVLPIKSKGPTPGTVASPRSDVVPKLPANLERLDTPKQIHSLAEVDLRWSPARADDLADRLPRLGSADGILGGLPRY